MLTRLRSDNGPNSQNQVDPFAKPKPSAESPSHSYFDRVMEEAIQSEIEEPAELFLDDVMEEDYVQELMRSGRVADTVHPPPFPCFSRQVVSFV